MWVAYIIGLKKEFSKSIIVDSIGNIYAWGNADSSNGDDYSSGESSD